MTDTSNKLRYQMETVREIERKLDEPIEAAKWKNLYFTFDGKSYLGLLVHDSEDIARERLAIMLQRPEPKIQISGKGEILDDQGRQFIWQENLSHVIQIPVKET